MKENSSERFNEFISRQLSRLEKYGKLLEKQEALIAEENYEELLQVLERKARIIKRMGNWDNLHSMARVAADQGSDEARESGELLSLLLARLDLFAGREAATLKKAATVREDIAEGIFALRKGKKVLSKYLGSPLKKKARFKDIKT